MIFDAATATVSATTMPPGEFQPHLRTSENELCWIRETPEGTKKLVYGSLIVPDNSITMLVEVPYTKDDEHLRMEHLGVQLLAYLKEHVSDPAAKAEGLATFGKLQQAFDKTIDKQYKQQQQTIDEQQQTIDMLKQQLSSEPHFWQPASA